MGESSSNKANGFSFSVASLFLLVGLFAVCFAVAKLLWLVGLLMAASLLPAVGAVWIACLDRSGRREVRPPTLFLTVAGITFVLLVWWGVVGYMLGIVAGHVSAFTDLFDSVNASADDLPLAGAAAGVVVGWLCGVITALDLVLIFAPTAASLEVPLPASSGRDVVVPPRADATSSREPSASGTCVAD